MKFIIEDEKKSVDVKLYIKKEGDYVQVCGDDGKKNRIIISFKDGKFLRHPFANLNGILTNDGGFIIEERR